MEEDVTSLIGFEEDQNPFQSLNTRVVLLYKKRSRLRALGSIRGGPVVESLVHETDAQR